jgi:hypothetical protein
MARDELDGYASAKFEVLSQIDLAHATRAKLRVYFVMAKAKSFTDLAHLRGRPNILYASQDREPIVSRGKVKSALIAWKGVKRSAAKSQSGRGQVKQSEAMLNAPPRNIHSHSIMG